MKKLFLWTETFLLGLPRHCGLVENKVSPPFLAPGLRGPALLPAVPSVCCRAEGPFFSCGHLGRRGNSRRLGRGTFVCPSGFGRVGVRVTRILFFLRRKDLSSVCGSSFSEGHILAAFCGLGFLVLLAQSGEKNFLRGRAPPFFGPPFPSLL